MLEKLRENFYFWSLQVNVDSVNEGTLNDYVPRKRPSVKHQVLYSFKNLKTPYSLNGTLGSVRIKVKKIVLRII